MTKFDSVIPSGSEGKVYASVDISHVKGIVEKSVDVESNDPAQPHLKLTIKANIKSYFDILPMEQVRFTVSKGSLDSQEVTIVPTYEKPIKLLTPKVSSTDAFEVKMTPPAAGKQEYKLVISMKNSAQVGTQNAIITVPVEGGIVPDPEIQVIAVVRGPIAANPPLISFQIKSFPDEVSPVAATNIYQQPDETTAIVMKSDAGSPLRVIAQKDQWYQIITGSPSPSATSPATTVTRVGWVRIKDVKTSKQPGVPDPQAFAVQKSSGTFKIVEFTCTFPNVKLSYEPKDGEANSFNFKAVLEHPEQAQKNTPAGSIVIKTNDPDQPEVRIPVYLIVS